MRLFRASVNLTDAKYLTAVKHPVPAFQFVARLLLYYAVRRTKTAIRF
jgi:hypothetical protein